MLPVAPRTNAIACVIFASLLQMAIILAQAAVK
jgi:hypothetical protein